jgi:hypothetical protein
MHVIRLSVSAYQEFAYIIRRLVGMDTEEAIIKEAGSILYLEGRERGI